MTDRGVEALRTSAQSFTVGPSSLHWDGRQLTIEIDELSSLPLVSRLRGHVVITPHAVTDVELPLTNDGAHVWRPFAPISDIHVEIDRPGWSWDGHGYFDANFGIRALEQDFSYWTWGRFPTRSGSVCFYDAERLDGTTLEAGFRFGKDGSAEAIPLPPKAPVARSGWGVRRETRADRGYAPRQVKPMLDAPFYTRAAVRTQVDGEETVGVHEALDLRRFRSPLLKPMLVKKMFPSSSHGFL
ncbi:MAG: carotenoid 1,2-hydratase [Pseudomonadota bacterium]